MVVHRYISGFLDTLRVVFCLGRKTETSEVDVEVEDPPEEVCRVPRIDHTQHLPPTLLSTIFRHHLQIYLDLNPSSPFIEPHPTAPPLILSQVNRFWRHVALEATPELWSTIWVGNSLNIEIVDLWVKRSRTGTGTGTGKLTPVPLDIRIDGVHTPQDVKGSGECTPQPVHSSPQTQRMYRKTKLGRAWCVLRAEFRRWRRVEMVLDHQACLYFMELPLIAAKGIQSLSLHVVGEDKDDVQSLVLDSVYAYVDPQGVKVKWESTPMVGTMRHPVWGGLRRIHVTMAMTMDESVSFLRRCLQAEEVSLGCISNDFLELLEDRERDDLGSLGEITRAHGRQRLMNLRSLSIGFDGASCDCTRIVQFFTLPSLRRLRLYNFNSTDVSCMRVVDFLNRSEAENDNEDGWRFEELSIVDWYMSESILSRLLCTPELGPRRVPAVSYYTRRRVRLEVLIPTLDCVGKTEGLEYYQDARGGTWIGRKGLPDTYLLL